MSDINEAMIFAAGFGKRMYPLSTKVPKPLLKVHGKPIIFYIIEDLIKAAHNNAKSDLKTKTSEEISKTTSGFGIPGFKWPL